MAQSLQDRVSTRFGSVVVGSTGAGALDSQGHPVNPAHGKTTFRKPPSTLPEFQQEGPPAPEIVLLEGAVGLPGGFIEDATPRTHAAPSPGWVGDVNDGAQLAELHANSMDIHATDFGALAQHTHTNNSLPQPAFTTTESNNPGENVLEPVKGQLQAMGGYDTTQGYDLRNRYGFDAGHRKRDQIEGNVVNAFLDSSERPFIVPQPTGSFVPTDAVQGPPGGSTFLNAPSVNATPQTAYTPPPESDTSPQPPAGSAPASVGWW